MYPIKLDKSEIKKFLPHDGPIAVLDQALILSEKEAEASFVLSSESDLARGHFPPSPVIPGSFLLEAMAQTADLILLSISKFHDTLPLLLSVSNLRFLAPAPFQKTITLTASLTKLLDNGMADFEVKAFAADTKVATGRLTILCK